VAAGDLLIGVAQAAGLPRASRSASAPVVGFAIAVSLLGDAGGAGPSNTGDAPAATAATSDARGARMPGAPPLRHAVGWEAALSLVLLAAADWPAVFSLSIHPGLVSRRPHRADRAERALSAGPVMASFYRRHGPRGDAAQFDSAAVVDWLPLSGSGAGDFLIEA
jgi:hypothetical protein